ncbi:MAG: Re/Si-specific NAD(P)(+) transhydrogenase subunit alpha [Acidobacteriota bacterium]
MQIGVLKETVEGERRVALVPESVQRLVKAGHSILVQAGAGEASGNLNAEYEKAGGALAAEADEIVPRCDILVKVRAPDREGARRLKEGALLIALMEAARNEALLQELASAGVTVLALEQVPRIARAQNMDVLSSMSTVSGYKAVLLAAVRLPRFFPLLMTAAGTIPPARVLIIGAGVAGLQAIATARRLGARVEAFDPRPAAREQVESLGGRFVGAELLDAAVETAGGYAREQTGEEQARQREALKGAVAGANVVICSALVAGRKAPVVLDEAMVRSMKAGSVIIDLAAEQGGNCELTQAGQEVVCHGVMIHGPENVPSLLPRDASRMFSRNVANLLRLLIKDGSFIDFQADEVARACLAVHQGKVWSGGQPAMATGSGASS